MWRGNLSGDLWRGVRNWLKGSSGGGRGGTPVILYAHVDAGVDVLGGDFEGRGRVDVDGVVG